MRAQEAMFLQMTRVREESGLNGRCRIVRGSGEGTLNEETGRLTRESTAVYEGKCLIRPAQRDHRKVDFGGDQLSVHVYEVTLPHNSEVEVLDVLIVTGSPDPGLVGRHLVVRDVLFSDWQTARKIVCEEVR